MLYRAKNEFFRQWEEEQERKDGKNEKMTTKSRAEINETEREIWDGNTLERSKIKRLRRHAFITHTKEKTPS